MTVSLSKGQLFNLQDDAGKMYSDVTVGLGWDAAVQKEGNFLKRMFTTAQQIDCDATVLMLKNNKINGIDDIVFYDKLEHKSGSVVHKGDNRTGEGDGDDEQILVHLDKVPDEYERLVFIVNIFEPVPRKQNFGMINNAFIRIVDNASGSEICRFNLTSDNSNDTAMLFGELIRNDEKWQFKALGEGTADTCLEDVVKRYH